MQFNSHIKKDQFGPRSIEEIKNEMLKAKQSIKEVKTNFNVNNQPQSNTEIKARIDNMNNLRHHKWK